MFEDENTKLPLESIPVTLSPQNNKSMMILNNQPKKKLLSDEELCLSKLLEQCISQVETAVTLQMDSLSDIEDKEMRSAFEKHKVLCERLEEANELKSQEDREAKESTDAQLKSEVKNSFKNMLRVLRNDPDDGLHLSLVPEEDIGNSEQLLIKSLKTFYHYTLENLLNLKSPEEELHLKIKPLQVSLLMEASLNDRTANLANQISDIDVEIFSHKTFISNWTRQQVPDTLLTDKDFESYVKTPKHVSQQQELDQLNIQLNNVSLKDREKERLIQEKTEMVEEDIESVIDRFDQKMQENQNNLEAREAELRRDEEELKRLEKQFVVLEVEYNDVVERRQVAEDKKREEQKMLELKTKAAIMAQAWWRGYSVRKHMKNKGKKKKAKKGKGKKK